jgi:SRSO17 transposase
VRTHTGRCRRHVTTTARELVGGPEAVLIINETALAKLGCYSAAVARQYCGVFG